LTVIDSTIRDNIAGATVAGSLACGNGGGIRSGSGALKLINSTVAGNSTATGRGRGGGIHIGCGGTAVFTNTTISGNRASPRSDNAVSRNRRGHGGGVNLHGALRLVNCTISDNRAIGPGGGLYVRGHLDFVNTIVANNASGSGNCVVSGPDAYGISGSLGTNSLNLVADGTCDPDFSGDPMLSHLDDNGGNTLTQALLPGSPAIDAIPVVSCTLPTDQRGGLRPVVQVSPETPCDIGAFEVQPEESSETSPESSPSGTGWSQMVLVPAGESVMGSDEGRGDEGPVHRVTLDAFYIDRMEVTNAQFAHFLNERGNKEEGGETWLDDDDEDCLIKRRGSHFQPKAGYEDHPVIEVTWYGARAYCAWRGQEVGEPLRLPTEAEWEKAASWDPTTGVKQVYPWGDRWDRSVVNADWPITDTTELGPHTSPVTDHVEGASRSGALNMGGNVWEWVSDWYASDYYAYSPSQNPQVPDAGEDKVLRGGSWRSPREFVRTTVRHHWFPDYTFDIGFRCARSAEDAVGP
jgi:formylglycine-generating enzyme required for sulfatase activity